MCRFAAYLGEPVLLEDLLYKPDGALVRQALDPELMSLLNVGGFGLAAWDRRSPGPRRPLISRGFGGEVEKFIGDAIMVTFNSRGDQPDHAVRAARAGLELQHQMGLLAARHPGWPKLRVGVNTGPALVRAMGGPGYVSFAVVGDTINTASRLQAQAPVGGVLIGAGTYHRLPLHAEVEARPGLWVKGKQAPVDAYVLRSVPDERRDHGRHLAGFQRRLATRRRRSPEPERTR